jgi:hypothetical protein
MIAMRVEIVRYVDATFPGFVECQLIDAHGRQWSFIEKVPVVTVDPLDAESGYPCPGTIACEVLEQTSETARVSTATPWGVESVEGETEFEVPLECLTSS